MIFVLLCPTPARFGFDDSWLGLGATECSETLADIQVRVRVPIKPGAVVQT